MRESRPYGSVRGALRNERPYRDRSYVAASFAHLARNVRQTQKMREGPRQAVEPRDYTPTH